MKLFVVAFCVAALAAPYAAQDRGFSLADANGDGKIVRAELAGLFNSFDDDSSGSVDFIEFITHYSMGTGLSLKASAYVFYLEDANESGALTTDELEGIFITFDLDVNGEVTLAEYGGVMAGLEAKLVALKVTGDKLEALFDATDDNSDAILTPAEFGKVFQGADINLDGKVSEAEFIALWKAKIDNDEANAKTLFALLDQNKDGFYGGDAERLATLNAFDANGDGNVSKDEFNYLFIFLAAREDRAAAGTGPVGF